MVISYKHNELKISPKAFTKLVKLGVWWEPAFEFITPIAGIVGIGWYQQHFFKRMNSL